MVAQLDALPPIPHKLHIIFPHKGIVNSTTPMAMHGVRRMIELNPGWAWKVYDDDEIDKYIGQELTRPDPILTPKEVGVLQKAHPIEKTDAARLLIMWYEGGFYQDADRVYSVPMSKVISPEVKMVRLPAQICLPPTAPCVCDHASSATCTC
jgi:mannosyltransferase OCH1-like enzyme